jgi:hypothetical protein
LSILSLHNSGQRSEAELAVRLKHLLLAAGLIHLCVIAFISARDIIWLVGHRLTILPASFVSWAEKAENSVSDVHGKGAQSSGVLRTAWLTYLHLAGIERGYGYFAPNVGVSYKLVLELHYPDGQVGYEVPGGGSSAVQLRMASFLDEIGRSRDDQVRQYFVKMLARPVWREHPEVQTMRAVFGYKKLPTIAEFERGERESYEFLYAYDFSLADSARP